MLEDREGHERHAEQLPQTRHISHERPSLKRQTDTGSAGLAEALHAVCYCQGRPRCAHRRLVRGGY